MMKDSCYYQLALRPLLAWDAALESARDLMHVLSSDHYKDMDYEEKDSFHRVFWACSIVMQYVLPRTTAVHILRPTTTLFLAPIM